MKKNNLKRMVTAVIAATTIVGFSSLGVSAATTNSNFNDYCNTIASKLNKSDSGMNEQKLNFFYNTGTMQNGVVKINGKTYSLTPSSIMKMRKTTITHKTYTTNSNGQFVESQTSVKDKISNSNDNVTKDNTSTTTVDTTNSNQETTITPVVTATTPVETTTTESVTKNTTNTENSPSASNVVSDKTTNNVSTSGTSIDVQGLPALPTNYSINVQASAEQKILELMNAKRTEAGLQPLTMDNTLLQVARYKSDHMIQFNYFSHTNPDGTKWTNWLQTLGYKYTTTGENIAYNTNNPVELFNQWWNSEGHRANMMNPSYTKVGIGVINGNGKYMGTQEFSN